MHYNTKFIISTLLLLLAVASFNRLVDPYGLFWNPVYEGINKKKTLATNRARITKELYIKTINPEVVLIGNSRIEMGFDATNSAFSGQRVYNFASPGLSFETQIARAYYALNHIDDLKEIYLSLDFIDFLLYADKVKKTAPKLITANSNGTLSYYLSLQTTIDSLKTLFTQNSTANHIDVNGTHIPEDYISIIKFEGITQLYKQKLQQIKNIMNNPRIRLYDEQGYSPHFELLNAFLNSAKERGITLKAFINPYQITYVHVVADANRLTMFGNWKKELTTIFADYETPLIDFSSINEFTLEQVSSEQKHSIPDYFWEPAHYTATLGDIMLRDLNKNTGDLSAGHELTPANIDVTLQTLSNALDNKADSWQQLQSQLGLK